MILRAARDADIPAILGIWNPLIRETLITFTTEEKTASAIAAMIRDHGSRGRALIVAERAGAVAGFAAYAPFRGGPGYIRTLEHSVHVAPEAHGRGTGRALVGALEERARAEKAGSLWAAISGANPAGRTFYARLGFREAAVLPRVGFKAGRWLDLHLMVKWLAADDNPS